MVTVSGCRGCQDQFPAQDLCSDRLCVRCYDKVPEYWEKPRQTIFVSLSDEEKKRRRKITKRRYQINNKEKIATAERNRRAKLKVERRE